MVVRGGRVRVTLPIAAASAVALGDARDEVHEKLVDAPFAWSCEANFKKLNKGSFFRKVYLRILS